MPYQIPDWDEFQQYRDRKPTWIKFHRSLLDNRQFQNLPLAARAMLPMLWLLASENKDYMSGIIDMSNDDICFRLRITETELVKNLDILLTQGFITVVRLDTEMYENVLRDREETEKRREETEGPRPHKMPFSELPQEWAKHCAQELGWTAEIAADVFSVFRDYWQTGKGKNTKRLGWDATWRTWCRQQRIQGAKPHKKAGGLVV